MPSQRGQYNSFFVRIWSQGERGELAHGQVVDLRSRRARYFRAPTIMVAFMLARLKPTMDDPDEQSQLVCGDA
jgi:hypothetical protein